MAITNRSPSSSRSAAIVLLVTPQQSGLPQYFGLSHLQVLEDHTGFETSPTVIKLVIRTNPNPEWRIRFTQQIREPVFAYKLAVCAQTGKERACQSETEIR